MKKKKLRDAVDEAVEKDAAGMTALWEAVKDALPPGQLKRLRDNEDVKRLLERFGIEEKEK